MLISENDRIMYNDLNIVNSTDFSEHGFSNVHHMTYCNFAILKKNVCLLGMKYPSVIYFRGILEIICIQGEVDILGHIVKSGNKCEVFSLLGSSAMYIATTENSIIEEMSLTSVNKYFTDRMNMKKVKDICEDVGRKGALLLLISRINLYEHWRQMLSERSIDIFPDSKSPEGISYFRDAEEALNCTFDYYLGTRIDRKLTVHDSWEEYVKALVQERDAHSRLMICGGKGFGKSTLLRYLVNRTLVKIPQILIIDFDIGQSEMNLSGCISCYVVNKPLLGPSFTHLQEPRWSIFLGKVNPVQCVAEYIKAVQELVNKCNFDSSLAGLPWIINTMGFSRGIGVILACAAVRAVRPTTLLVLKSEQPQLKQHNFSQPLVFNKMANLALHHLNYPDENFSCNVITVEAPADVFYNQPQHQTSRFPSKKLREAAEIIYFSEKCHEVSLQIQSLEHSSDGWKNCHPGDIVSLCKQAEFHSCIGFGRVTYVDKSSSMVYIRTPVNLSSNSGELIAVTYSAQKLHEMLEIAEKLTGVSAEKNEFISWRSTVHLADSKIAFACKMFSVCLD